MARWFLLLFTASAACARDYPDASRLWAAPAVASASYPETVHSPSALGRLDTRSTNASGETVGIACATCHAPGVGPALAEGDGPPEHFHDAVRLEHGGLACASCHDQDRTRLRLADGTTLEFGDAIRLCAQCHGPQYRDYQHGAHGGMSGYWDLSSGPRERNHCLDCHAAHDPAYPSFLPVSPPKDRHMGGREDQP